MMGSRIFIVVFVFLLMISCQSNNEFSSNHVPNKLLNQGKFIRVLGDMIILEATANQQSPNLVHAQKVMDVSSDAILKKHQITKSQYTEAYEFYTEDKEKMLEIYTQVLDDYNIRLSKIK